MKKKVITYDEFIEEAFNNIKSIVDEILRKNKKFDTEGNNKVREKLKKEFKELSPPVAYIGGLLSYIDYGLSIFDPNVKKFFENIFYDDLKNHPKLRDRIPYYILRVEGLYDMLALDKYEHIPIVKNGKVIWEHKQPPWLTNIELRAKSNRPILIVGKTGTSKELMAKAIHKLSSKPGEFIERNCAAIPETLLESEFFGVIKDYPGFHNKQAKKGIIESANNGSLFLDEIGKSSINFQSKLLKVMDEKKYSPLGSNEDISVDVRIIAAIQPSDIDDEKFLPDLKWRLCYPYVINMPTLKERLSDKIHAGLFLQNSLVRILREKGEIDKIKKFTLSHDACGILINHEYEGNYRELENILDAATDSAIYDERNEIIPSDLYLISKNTKEASESMEVNATYDNIELSEIINYAEKQAKFIKQRIVESKMQEFVNSNGNVEKYFKDKGLTMSQYRQFLKKVKDITNKGKRGFQKQNV